MTPSSEAPSAGRPRRLSTSHLPQAPPTPVSQIDEELLFHIARGGLAADVPGLVDPNFPEINDPRDPNCIKKTKPDWQTVTVSSGQSATVYEKACVAETDFVVLYHWGMVELLVETGTGRVRRAEDAEQYRNDFDAATAGKDRLVYRLADLPAEADRSPNHKLTDKHYELARDLFATAYSFFTSEFAHRDNLLGPPSTHPSLTGASTAAATRLAIVAADDTSAGAVPGTVAGFVLHPDYPAPDGGGPKRQSHANHIHANFGSTKPTGGEFER